LLSRVVNAQIAIINTMKKSLLSLIAAFISFYAFAQQDSKPTIHAAPHIRTERKELKREHYADRPQKSEMHIHRNKHELHHGKSKQHEWKRNHHTRPVKKGTPHKKRPMTDRRHK
jgi:hypothetical protein